VATTFLFADGTRLYSVDRPVGSSVDTWTSCDNRTDDVMLVQFLLRRIWSGKGDGPLGPRLVVDGTFGPATHYWTLYFQAKATFSWRAAKVTGVLDNVFGSLGSTKVDKDGGTYHLNDYFALMAAGSPVSFGGKSVDLTADSSVPPLLQSALRKNVIETAASISPR
jgi:hypothetical protein